MPWPYDAAYPVIVDESFEDLMCTILSPHIFQGRKVFKQLKQLESKGVKLQIAVNAPQASTQDTAELAAAGTSRPDNMENSLCCCANCSFKPK